MACWGGMGLANGLGGLDAFHVRYLDGWACLVTADVESEREGLPVPAKGLMYFIVQNYSIAVS